jgi:hypothetical protein
LITARHSPASCLQDAMAHSPGAVNAHAGSLPHLPEQRCGLVATLALSQPPTQQGHGGKGQFIPADCQLVTKLYSLGLRRGCLRPAMARGGRTIGQCTCAAIRRQVRPRTMPHAIVGSVCRQIQTVSFSTDSLTCGRSRRVAIVTASRLRRVAMSLHPAHCWRPPVAARKRPIPLWGCVVG